MIKSKVVELIEKHKTNNPFEIASSEKVFVHFWDLHDDIQGVYKYVRRNKYIFLNNNLEEWKIKFVLFHELGHAILHPRLNTPFMRSSTLLSVDKNEVEANKFAVEMLMTDDAIYQYKDTNLSINEIANIYGVPKEVSHLKKLY